MSDTLNIAPPAAPLTVPPDGSKHLFVDTGKGYPCMLAVPGSSKLELHPLVVRATGKVKPTTPGTLTIILYAIPGNTPPKDDQNPDPEAHGWLPIASAVHAPTGDLSEPEASWMLIANDLLYNLTTGKMQGTYRSNVADSPIPEADIDHDLHGVVANADPVIQFAVGASFEASDTGSEEGAELELVLFDLAS
jgi:hypothetical protein